MLPPGLTLDTFEGRAYVGLIPFTISGVRLPRTPALPWLSRFHEVNLRTYVHHERHVPGVWLFSLDAASVPAVVAARLTYGLPYWWARISLSRELDNATGTTQAVRYDSRRRGAGPRPATLSIRYGPAGPAQRAAEGSLEHFLVERYVLYAADRQRLYRARVHHAPLPLQTAWVRGLDESLLAAAGLARPEAEPLAHYAREVTVEIFRPRRVTSQA